VHNWLGHHEDDSNSDMQAEHVVRVRAERNFDQMKFGQEAVVDLNDSYWSNHVRGGNVSVIAGLVIPLDSMPEVEHDIELAGEEQELEGEVDYEYGL